MKVEKTEQIRAHAEKTLSEARFLHVCGVVSTAKNLAQIYGESEYRAELAAWLHDIAREWDMTALRKVAQSVAVPEEFWSIPELLHGPVAAFLGRETYQIHDEDVLQAVYYHTSGRPNMSLLEKILFVADAIEPGRTYSGVDEIRLLAQNQLNNAVLASLDSTITYLVRMKQPIGTLTIMARNSLLSSLWTDKACPKRQEE